MSEEELKAEVERLKARNEILEKKWAAVTAIFDSIILGVGNIVESRDQSTGHHVARTSRVVEVFVNELLKDPDFPLDERFCKCIIKAAPLHDIGKIAVKDAVLQKKGRFIPEEFEIMKSHAAAGGKTVYWAFSDIPDTEFVSIAIHIAKYHHERWDGSGYPNGLVGEQIPIEARIMALADVFDALISRRCYKDSISFDDAFRIIEESVGTHFDPVLGKKFLECRPKLEALYTDMMKDEINFDDFNSSLK